jgi:hypothetical protein
MVALLRRARLADDMVVINQIRIPLAGLRPEEPVPALETPPARPVASRRGEIHLVVGTEVPLAHHVGVPPALAEDLRQHPVLRRDRPARVRDPIAASMMQAMLFRVWLRPVSRHERVGEHSAVVCHCV